MFESLNRINFVKFLVCVFAGSFLIAVIVLLLVFDDAVGLSVSFPEDEVEDPLAFIFKHGDRTPDINGLYPKDPYINYTYPPYGLDQLTKNGKKSAYKLGEELRARYGKFLGSNYNPDKFSIISTDYTRTKMYLLLVLASLFRPNEENSWDDDLNWQPIPYDYTKYKKDYVKLKLFFAGFHCPNMMTEYQKVLKLKEVKDKLDAIKPVLDLIHETTGRDLHTDPNLAWGLFFTLQTQFEYGLELPEPTKLFFLYPLYDVTVYQYKLLTYNTDLKRFIAGNFIKKIVADTEENSRNDEKKLYLYSAHDITIAGLLRLLDLFERHIPPYEAYLALEVHKIDGVLGIKVYYQDYRQEKIKLRVIPGCKELCPLEAFKEIVEPFYFNPENCGNL